MSKQKPDKSTRGEKNEAHSTKGEVEEEIIYDTDMGSGAVSFEKKLKKVKTDLKKCKEERQEYLDGWQRSKADFVNLKKRTEEDKLAFTKYANEEFILELLPALDSFDQAFKDKKSWEKASLDWRMGIEFIYSQLRKVLENHDVSIIDPVGQKFDEKLHHSIDTVEVEDKKEDGKIVDVISKGYALGEKIIRHPNVKVGVWKKD